MAIAFLCFDQDSTRPGPHHRLTTIFFLFDFCHRILTTSINITFSGSGLFDLLGSIPIWILAVPVFRIFRVVRLFRAPVGTLRTT